MANSIKEVKAAKHAIREAFFIAAKQGEKVVPVEGIACGYVNWMIKYCKVMYIDGKILSPVRGAYEYAGEIREGLHFILGEG